MSARRIAIVLLIIAGTIGFLILNSIASGKEQLRSLTSYSDGATGLSIFYDLAQQTHLGGAVRFRTAVLEPEQLKDAGAVIIASPLTVVSRHEISLLRAFVDRGGLLVLSFHDNSSHNMVADLLQNFKLTEKDTPDLEFQDGTYRRIKVNELSFFAPSGSTLGLYSAMLNSNQKCATDRFSCFFEEIEIGKGHVAVFNGLLPIVNALIGVEQNREIAFSILNHAVGPVVIDEYHHLYSDKTIGDLLSDIRVMFPIAALLAGAVLFFVLGDRGSRDIDAALEERRPVPTYHAFTSRIFAGSLQRKLGIKAAAQYITEYLQESFAGDAARIESTLAEGKPDASLREVIALHKKLLRERNVLNEEKL